MSLDPQSERLYQRPQQFDAVLGGDRQAARGSVSLGGIEAVVARLNGDNIQLKILALKDAMKYGDRGLDLVAEYLQDREMQIAEAAYELLASRSETFIQERVQRYLDDRDLEKQDLQYSWLESDPEACATKQFKTRKKSQSNNDRQSRSRSLGTTNKTSWHDAS